MIPMFPQNVFLAVLNFNKLCRQSAFVKDTCIYYSLRGIAVNLFSLSGSECRWENVTMDYLFYSFEILD